MKTLEQIYKEFDKIVPENTNRYIGDDDEWKMYRHFCWYKEDNAVLVYFRIYRKEKPEIEISSATSDVLVPKIIAMLKSIEPECEIMYYKKEAKYI